MKLDLVTFTDLIALDFYGVGHRLVVIDVSVWENARIQRCVPPYSWFA